MTNSYQNLEPLIEKLNQLEDKINSLEKSRESENYTAELKNAVRVEGAVNLPQLCKLNLSTSKLVEIYNDVPEVLASSAIEVTLTPETYRGNTYGEIFVEKFRNGNYWAIAKDNVNYWLVPKGNIKINTHKQKTLKSLFTFEGNQLDQDFRFTLVKPATASVMPNGKSWKLQEGGILDFNNVPFSSQLETELVDIRQEQKNFKLLLEQAEAERKEIRSNIEKFSNEMQLMHSQISKISEIRDFLVKFSNSPQAWINNFFNR